MNRLWKLHKGMLNTSMHGSYMNLKPHCERNYHIYSIIQAPSFFVSKFKKNLNHTFHSYAWKMTLTNNITMKQSCRKGGVTTVKAPVQFTGWDLHSQSATCYNNSSYNPHNMPCILRQVFIHHFWLLTCSNYFIESELLLTAEPYETVLLQWQEQWWCSCCILHN